MTLPRKLLLVSVGGLAFGMLAAALLLTQFSDEWGPTPCEVVDVEGRVTLGGRPIPGGWVEFIPIDGALGGVRSARLGSDGRFRATRVARGRNVMRVVYPPRSAGVDRVFQQFFTPVRPVIRSGQFLEIELRTEALRARRAAVRPTDATQQAPPGIPAP